MSSRKYIFFALMASLAILFSWGAYFFNFGEISFSGSSAKEILNLSDDKGDWGAFGDFVGGLTNPILTFITTCLLIGSIGLQRKANELLVEDSKAQREREDVRFFESSLYSLVEVAKSEYSNLSIFSDYGELLREADAVSFIERMVVEAPRVNDIGVIFDDLDGQSNLRIVSAVRAFCIPFKLMSENCPSANKDKYREIYGHLVPVRMIHLLCLAEACTTWSFLRYPRDVGFFEIKANKEYICAIKKQDLQD